MSKLVRFPIMLAVFISAVSLAVAQDATFVQITGINGESTDVSHVDWIDAYGIDEGYSYAGGPNIEDLAILKGTDKSTPKLHDRLLQATAIASVVVEVCRSTSPQQCYYRIELTNARVTTMSLAGTACIDPATSCTPPQTESVTFSAEQILWRYTEYDAAGNPQGTVEFCWNVIASTQC